MKTIVIIGLGGVFLIGLLPLTFPPQDRSEASIVTLVRSEYSQKCLRGQETFYDDKKVKCKLVKHFLEKYANE